MRVLFDPRCAVGNAGFGEDGNDFGSVTQNDTAAHQAQCRRGCPRQLDGADRMGGAVNRRPLLTSFDVAGISFH
jgi:hypothetical protein